MEVNVSRALNSDQFWAPLLEGTLILAVAGIGWGLGRPLLFASLGPTAYEQIEQPNRKTAKPWAVLVGHYVAVGAGFLALWAVQAWNAAHIGGSTTIPLPRLWASVIAVVLTVFGCLLFRASQPAALSTALLITTGAFQGPSGAVAILIAVALITVIGEPVRRFRARQREKAERKEEQPRLAA